MIRPFHTWLACGIALAVVLVAVGWVSMDTIRLDQAQWQAAARAQDEEKVRLALWRMDSSVLPLVIDESSRLAQTYEPFYSAGQAFTKGTKGQYASAVPGDVLLPSPLLFYESSLILLHFQFIPGRPATSPQVPEGILRGLALSNYVSQEKLSVHHRRLEDLRRILKEKPLAELAQRTSSSLSLSSVVQSVQVPIGYNADVLYGMALKHAPIDGSNAGPNPALMQQQRIYANNQIGQQEDPRQNFLNTAELNVRGNVYQQAQVQAVQNLKNQSVSIAQSPANEQQKRGSQTLPQPPSGEGVFKAVWIGGELFMVRRVVHHGIEYVQGCWLNWTNLKQSLLSNVRDLLPEARLLPVSNPADDASAHLLASLPVKLAPAPASALNQPFWTPVLKWLAIAWTGIILSIIAMVALLYAAVSLSERRASFVSSVTHELRTPLTTFKMYSEMLADGMVQDEEKRRQYLNTLCSEANRLSHLVENVLAYARLERGSARRNTEVVSLKEMIERILPRLNQRAEHAGMHMVVDADERALSSRVCVDVSAVEQILFNLVDNAGKYAAPNCSEKVIHLEAFSPDSDATKHAMLRVRDHGQGISAAGARRLFKPFSKSANEAAHSAPGVGLGLALSRRLSRHLGGNLRWVPAIKNGACFELTLPLAAGD